MAVQLTLRPWWAFVVRGLLGILFGILTFVVPGAALLTLVFLFGAWALVDGFFNIAAAVHKAEARRQPWWVMLLAGVAGVVAGLLAFFMPGLTALSLLYVIAAWMIVRGAFEIAAAVRLRRIVEREWLLALSGVLSVVVGVLLAAFPGAGALALALWIGAYAIVFGALLVALGVKLRHRTHGPHAGFGQLAPGGSH